MKIVIFIVFIRIGEALKYDKNFKGPLSKRSCTDLICLFIFIVFLGCWGFVGYWGKLSIDNKFFSSRSKIVITKFDLVVVFQKISIETW